MALGDTGHRSHNSLGQHSPDRWEGFKQDAGRRANLRSAAYTPSEETKERFAAPQKQSRRDIMQKIGKTHPGAYDLTQRPPRSCHVRLGGYVILPRLIDKARAALAGKLGDYYDGPDGMNGHFLRFVGVKHAALKRIIAKGGGDAEILAWVEAHARPKRQPWEIAAWSDFQTKRPVDSDAETLEGFAQSMRRLHPGREDIKTRFDFLDLDDHCSFGGRA